MFEPGLANLFEPLGVIWPAAHPIKILRNDRVISIRQGKPIDGLVAIITRSRCNCETDLCSSVPEFLHVGEISYNYIGPVSRCWRLCLGGTTQRRHRHPFDLTVDKLLDFHRLHCHTDGDFSDHRPSV